ncbi:peptide deformylase [Streptomyces collinus]
MRPAPARPPLPHHAPEFSRIGVVLTPRGPGGRYTADGAGLAANQVGVGLRVFVYDCPDGDGVRHVGHIVSPVPAPLDASRRRLLDEAEGCLSVPGATMDVPRPDRAVVRGVDRDGEPLVIEGTGYFARCLAHEADHCDGRLCPDRLSARERKAALRQTAGRRVSV